MEMVKSRIINLEAVVSRYFEFKGDEKEFKEYLDSKAKESSKDGAGDSVRDDKQQEVSKSK